jgi:DNA-binding transcriptional ArsR family regulator
MTEILTTPACDRDDDPLSMFAAMRAAADQAAELLRSIGSSHRLMILCLLMDGPKTVTEICFAIEARQSLVSQHLTRLRLDGLVNAERQGNFVLYSMVDSPAKEIVATLQRHFCPSKSAAAGH